MISVLKSNKLLLEENIHSKVNKAFIKKINITNVLDLYQLTKLYYIPSVHEKAFSYIQRNFTMLAATESFLGLDFSCVLKILKSSKLFITSEREVFNAANEWLMSDVGERRVHAKHLLLAVRLPLLPSGALRQLADEFQTFSESCAPIFEQVSNKNYDGYYKAVTSTRNCDQECFQMLAFGGYDRRHMTDWEVFNEVWRLPSGEVHSRMTERRRECIAVCVRGEVYVLGGWQHDRNKWVASVEKYSSSSKKWIKVSEVPDNRANYCACAYNGKIFVFGGTIGGFNNFARSSLQFDPIDCSWKRGGMDRVRSGAACVVFEEKIVICGGVDSAGELNSVVSYDVSSDTFLPMPDTNNSRTNHSLVVASGKLFVIDSLFEGCEVLDRASNKFVMANNIPRFLNESAAVQVANKIYIFSPLMEKFGCYDVEKDEYAYEKCDLTLIIWEFSCLKLPCY